MKTLPLILACLGSGVVGSVATHYVTPAQSTGDSNETVAELQSALEALRNEMQDRGDSVRALADAVDRMENETQLVPFVPERTAVPDVVTGGDEIAAVDATSEAITIGETRVSQAQFERWVKQANDNIRAQERAEREEERRIRDGERIEERVASLTTELGLDAVQQSEFRRHFEEQNIKRRDLMQSMRDGTLDRSQRREAWETMRSEANTDLQSFLSGDQYERYQESDNNDSNRFGRRGGGGDRGRAATSGGNNGGNGGAARGGGGRRGGGGQF